MYTIRSLTDASTVETPIMKVILYHPDTTLRSRLMWASCSIGGFFLGLKVVVVGISLARRSQRRISSQILARR